PPRLWGARRPTRDPRRRTSAASRPASPSRGAETRDTGSPSARDRGWRRKPRTKTCSDEDIRSRTGGAREWTTMMRVVIIGGGPGGYEAALVAAQLGADVSLVERDGLGGSTVLTDCVPSKTLIATAEVITQVREA